MILPITYKKYELIILQYNMLDYVRNMTEDEVKLFQRNIDKWNLWYNANELENLIVP